MEDFFHEICPKILELVARSQDKTAITVQKADIQDSADFATETDIAVEQLITGTLLKMFPEDAILAEEENSETNLEGAGRLWIIDPICGTLNFARGLPLYVSNIALAQNGTIIASCVVDHLSGKYYWSTGEGVYCNRERYQLKSKYQGTRVDLELGALISAPQGVKDRHARFVERILREEDGMCFATLNSSSSFLFVALGIFDGFVTPWVHPWDIAASAFLIQQSGGIITDLDGNPWTIATPHAVAARDPKLHAMLLQYLR